MKPSEKKLNRLHQIESLLLTHPRGFTQAELARKLKVHRSTINRYLPDLTGIFQQAVFEDEGRLVIDRSAYLVNVRLNLHEATAVHLAARLLTQVMDRQNPHAASALRKLGLALENLAPHVSRHMQQSADSIDEAARWNDQGYLRSLEVLTHAWSEGRKVRVWHRKERGEAVEEYIFCPYFIEPGAVGRSTYVIGWRQPPDALRTFKIERMERVELLNEPYTIPEDFDPRELLKDAWGIWFTDSQPVEVVLRFTPAVAWRLGETRWHRSEQISVRPDGSLLWRAKIAQPQEMIPWIRGWGADCEVLEPGWLREVLGQEVIRMAKIYQKGADVSENRYYAHTIDGANKSEWQPLIDHLKNTASLARDFGQAANVAEMAYIAGLLHDLGKYSREFQQRLDGKKIRVDHATAGAKELLFLLKGTPQESFASLLAYSLVGHHSGLLDYGGLSDLPGDGTLTARMKAEVCDYSAYKSELDLANLPLPKQLHIRPLKGKTGFSLAFLVRMVYSALVDADFQETETFIQGRKPRGGYRDVASLCETFNIHLRKYDNPQSEIDCKRTEVLKACVKNSQHKPGFFKLTVPTGGGKTLASMAFALNHAAAHGMQRIIYVIPYTTIIEQNAGVFKEILGEENVLEHHSNFDWERKKYETGEIPDNLTTSAYAKLKLAAENWDIPIVVTTNVQFFESLFANKSSRARKLHNIARSVIIFDEAQMLPRDYMLPAMSAVWELVVNYGASAVFCTATQPNLERFLPENTQLTELTPNPQELFDFYQRIEVKNLGTLTDEDLLVRLNGHEQTLCIVNTRRHASGLFQGLQGEGNYHLSTLMCAAHRRAKLREIRENLENGFPCRVVSTTVMEAGIDVDFPVGYRALTGLDSINQAAGRVNREMKRNICELFIFEPQSEFVKRVPKYIKQAAEVSRMVLREHGKMPISIPAIEAYFGQLYNLQDPSVSFDYKRIMECFGDHQGRFKFETAARAFKIIEDVSETVIIPYNEEVYVLIDELKHTQYPSSTLRKLQPYTVSIWEGEFERLNAKGAILTIADTYNILNPDVVSDYYDPDRGLLVPESIGGDALFF